MLKSLRMFETSEVAQRRPEIIQFYQRYGEKATKDAFGADRKLIGCWRKRLKENGDRLSAVVPWTIQEEFIQNRLHANHHRRLFIRLLAEYLIFHNTERPHKALGLKSPLEYLIEKGQMSQMSLTCTTT